MNALPRILIPLLFWVAMISVIGAFSDGPRFALAPPQEGRFTLALAHLTERIQPCRVLSDAERMALPPTRRVSEVCERPRVGLDVRLELDQAILLADRLDAPGLHADRRIQHLQRWPLQAGKHRLELRLSSPRTGAEIARRSIAFDAPPGAAVVLQVDDHLIALRHAALLNPEERR